MRIGFIGIGGIAENYLTSLKKLGRQTAGLCDINADRAGKAAAEYGGRAYADHRQMLEREKPEAVFVCLPPGAHTTQVVDAARSGAALFVAKPIALDLKTADAARDAIGKAGVINQVGYMARSSDITEKLKQLS